MSCKFKSVVVFFKILTCLLFSRSFLTERFTVFQKKKMFMLMVAVRYNLTSLPSYLWEKTNNYCTLPSTSRRDLDGNASLARMAGWSKKK